MNGSHGSPFKRMRLWSTLACALAFGLALALWVNGHALHGSLMLLAASALVPSSRLGRRARRRVGAQWPVEAGAAAPIKSRQAA